MALLWLVLEVTGSEALMGAVGFARAFPPVVLGLVIGVVVDRLNRRRLMVAANLARAALFASFPAAAALGHLTAVQLLMVAGGLSVASASFSAARFAMLSLVVPAGRLLPANALMSLAGQGLAIAAPLAGGWFMARAGTPALFGLLGLLHLASAAVLALGGPLERREPEGPGEAPEATPSLSFWGGAVEGVRYAVATPVVRSLILLFAVGLLVAVGPFSVGRVLYLKQVLGAGPQALGLFTTVAATGVILGMAALGAAPRVPYRSRITVASFGAWGLAMVLMALSPTLGVFLVGGFLGGLAMAGMEVPSASLMQERVPKEKLGRVYSLWDLTAWAGDGLSGLTVALVATATPLDPRWLLLTGGVLLVLLAGLGMGTRELREN